MSKFLLLPFLLLGFAEFSQGQNLKKPSVNEVAQLPEWAQLMYSEQPNVYEVDALYKAYFRTHEFEKSYHTQYYKRWRKAALPYLTDAGFIDLPEELEQRQIDAEFQ
ncbi:MAG: hypothetical protein ACO29Q_03930, partial [Crocinitomicaceae bacterium]